GGPPFWRTSKYLVPRMASTRRAQSATARPNTPTVSMDQAMPLIPVTGRRPKVGLNAATPQYAAGRITDPTVWLPKASGTIPAATAAADPEDEPPGARDVS